MSRTLLTGSIAYDLLLSYDGAFRDGLPDPSADTLSAFFVTQHFARHHGGCAANIAWGMRLLGADPLLVGTVGHDGGEYLALLDDRGIDVAGIEQRDDDVTATAIIGTDAYEQQIGFYHPGADMHGSWPDLNQARDDLDFAIVSPRNHMLMLQGLDWCKEFGVPVIFDPGQQVHAFADDELRHAMAGSFALIANDYEWDIISSRLDLNEESALEQVDILIVTRGEAGLTIFMEDGALNIPACTASDLVNPTGAGDALRAGLLYGLSNEWSILEAGRLGATMGSFAVECPGTLIDHIDRDEVWARAQETYGEELPE